VYAPTLQQSWYCIGAGNHVIAAMPSDGTGAVKIEDLQVDHFRIPLPVVLSDSTHGEMSHFGLVTARIECDSGQWGMG
jgi:hypothetical protein